MTVVEFQPSSWSAGSYLNVGAHFLWDWNGHLSFDVGDRVESLVRYESDAQFAPEAERLAVRAAAEVLSLRERLPAPSAVVASIPVSSAPPSWPLYHCAVSLGLGGETDAAATAFRRVADADGGDWPWAVDLRRRCRDLAALVADPVAFRTEIGGLIAAQRAALKLPQTNAVLPG